MDIETRDVFESERNFFRQYMSQVFACVVFVAKTDASTLSCHIYSFATLIWLIHPDVHFNPLFVQNAF